MLMPTGGGKSLCYQVRQRRQLDRRLPQSIACSIRATCATPRSTHASPGAHAPQLPALLSNGVTIVISPLVSLIQVGWPHRRRAQLLAAGCWLLVASFSCPSRFNQLYKPHTPRTAHVPPVARRTKSST